MAGTEEYGLQLNITTNATEVQNSLTEIKKLLDEMAGKDYKINIDTTSLKTLQDCFKSLSDIIGGDIGRQVNQTTNFIKQMTQSINKSVATLNNKSNETVYKEQANEINSLRETLEKYRTSSQQISQEEMDSIRGRVQALKELANTVQSTSQAQETGASKVSGAYSKMAQALIQIQNIETKAKNYITKTGANATAVNNTISSLQSYKAQIESIMASQTQLSSLTEAQYMKIVEGINNAKNALSQYQTTNAKNTSIATGIEKQSEALEKVKQAYTKLGSQVSSGSKSQQEAYKNIATEIKNIETALKNVNSADSLKNVSSSIKKVSSDMKNLKSEVQATTKSMSGVGDMFDRSLSYFTGRLMYEASATITRGFRDLISSTLEMNEAMTEMAMVTSRSISSVREDFKTYNELAKELKVSTEDISSAMITFVRQGYSLAYA